jgi:hypothetical protein
VGFYYRLYQGLIASSLNLGLRRFIILGEDGIAHLVEHFVHRRLVQVLAFSRWYFWNSRLSTRYIVRRSDSPVYPGIHRLEALRVVDRTASSVLTIHYALGVQALITIP